MRYRPHGRSRREPSGIDVTAFLSLMVILVPFLLITAVFTRITALEVQPAATAGGTNDPDPLQLLVIVRGDGIEIRHRDQSGPERIAWQDGGATLASVSTAVTAIKKAHPDSRAATVLVEPQISYERLVQVLDVLRVTPGERANGRMETGLFPLISLGPAPPATQWMQGAR